MSLPLCPQPPGTQPGLQWLWSLPNTLQQRGEGKRSFEGRKPEISVSDGRRKLALQGRRKRECNKGVRTSAAGPQSTGTWAMWFAVAPWRWMGSSRLARSSTGCALLAPPAQGSLSSASIWKEIH